MVVQLRRHGNRDLTIRENHSPPACCGRHRLSRASSICTKAVIASDGKRIEFKNAEDVSQWLIVQKLISTVPWDEAGAYLRFSVTFVARDQADEKRVLNELSERLAGVRFEF